MEWLGDPKNKKKIEVLGRFLKDWWPALAFAAGLFLTPFGGFIRSTIKLLRGFIPRILKIIPRLTAFAAANPVATAATIAAIGGTVGGIVAEKKLKKVDETLLQRRIQESKDKGKPLTPQEIEKIKTEQLQKRIQDIRGTNIPGSAFASGGIIPKFPMSGMNFGTGYDGIDTSTGERVSGFGPDTQAIIAQPGEIVINKKTVDAMGPGYFLGLNRQYGGPGANKPKMGKMFNTGGMVGKNSPNISNADYNTLLAISALEDDKAQGRADVAQSLYNRLYASSKYNTNFSQASNSLRDLITATGQYQPTFSNRKDWLNIKDRNSAALAIMNSEKGRRYKWDLKEAMRQLDSTEKALKNPALQQAAQKHVGGRAYFLGTSEQGNMRPGDVLRGPNSNFFSPWYMEGTQYDKERRNIAAPIPSMLLPKTESKKKPKKSNKGFWANFATMMQTYLPFRGGGLIKENTGMNIPGATADRQLAALQPGEYVLPAGTVSKLGVPFINMMVAMTDYDSTAAKLGKKPINRPSINPLPRAGMGGIMTLPPITQSAGGSMGGSSGGGSRVPSFSTISPSSGDERSMNASIYGIVG